MSVVVLLLGPGFREPLVGDIGVHELLDSLSMVCFCSGIFLPVHAAMRYLCYPLTLPPKNIFLFFCVDRQLEAQRSLPSKANNASLSEALSRFKDVYADYGKHRKQEASVMLCYVLFCLNGHPASCPTIASVPRGSFVIHIFHERVPAAMDRCPPGVSVCVCDSDGWGRNG